MTMNSIASQVRLHIESNPGEHLQYMDCPTCGKSGKLMMGPAKEGGYWFKCLSAGCATFGTTEARVSTSSNGPRWAGRKVYPPYSTLQDWYPTSTIPHQFLTTDYHLDEAQVKRLADGVVRERGNSYYVFPIYGPSHEARGYMLRKYVGSTPGPKALVRAYSRLGPLLNWFFSDQNPGTIAVVEDPISACRLSEYCTTVSLGGTSISEESVDEIMDFNPERIYVILDNDATQLSLDLARRFRGRGLPLPLFGPDVKDMNDDDFRDYLGAIISGR